MKKAENPSGFSVFCQQKQTAADGKVAQESGRDF